MGTTFKCPVCESPLDGTGLVCSHCGNEHVEARRGEDFESRKAREKRLAEKVRVWKTLSSRLSHLNARLENVSAETACLNELIEEKRSATQRLSAQLAEHRAEVDVLSRRISELQAQLERIGFIERIENGPLLEWRRHPFSDVLKGLELTGFMLEPSLHMGSAFGHKSLNVKKEDKLGVSWTWQEWSRVEAKFFSLGEPLTTKLYQRAQRPLISWQETHFCEAIEFTPFSANNEAGVTVKVDLPKQGDSNPIVFHPFISGFAVQLPGYIAPGEAYVRLYQLAPNALDANNYKLVGSHAFDKSGTVRIRPGGFRGWVAVIRCLTNGRTQLLDYRNYVSGVLSASADQEEWERVALAVNTRELARLPGETPALLRWLNQWPQRSRSILRALYRDAVEFLNLEPRAAYHFLQRAPKGLFRAVVLHHCGLAHSLSTEDLIARTDQGPLLEALGGLFPLLPKTLGRLHRVEEKQWAIGHAGDAKLYDAVEWAGNRGVAALDKAIRLVETRFRVKALVERLTSAGLSYAQEAREAASLLAEIEEAPWGNGQPDHLAARLRSIEYRAGAAKP